MTQRVLMADVAKLAGVSSQTVSRVLSGKGPVKPATKQRVRDAVAKLNYQPSVAAQILASGRSRAIGMLIMGQLSYGRMLSFAAFETVARRNGYFVIPTTTKSYDLNDLITAVKYLHQAQVCSLVVLGQRIDLIKALSVHISVPTVVAINDDPGIAGVSRVHIDQVNSTRALLEHLSDVGCDEIAYLGPSTTDVDAIVRHRTYIEFCETTNRIPKVVFTRNWGSKDGAEGARQLIEANSFDGIFAANDHLAIGCAYELEQSRSMVAGSDYALAGFDDIETAAYYYPGLTTVRQEYDQFADIVFDQLIALMNNESPEAKTVEPQLIIRGSTSNYAG